MSNINDIYNIDGQQIRFGYDSPLYYTLSQDNPDGTSGVMDLSTATIKAVLLSADQQTIIVPQKSLSSGAVNADWANGYINIDYSYTELSDPNTPTAVQIRGHYWLELQITIGGKKIPWPMIKVYADVGHIV